MSAILDNILVNVSTSVYLNEYGIIVGTKGDVDKLFSVASHVLNEMPLEAFVDPQYAHIAGSMIEHCIHTGESKTIRIRLRHEQLERELLFLPKDVSAVNWPEGAVVKFFDVTHFSDQMSSSDMPMDVFNTMLRDFDAGTVLLDWEGRIENMNSQAANMLGRRREFLIGSTLNELLESAETEEERNLLKELQDSNENSREGQSWINTVDGETLLLKYYPIAGNGHEDRHLVITLQSIAGGESANLRVSKVYEKLLHKIQVMSIYNYLANDFNVCVDEEQLFPRITRTLTIGLGLHKTIAILALRNDQTMNFELSSCFGIDPKDARALMVKPLGVAQHVFLPMRLHPNGEFLLHDGFIKMLYAPIIVDRKTIGYLSLFRKSQNYQLHEEEILMRIVTDNLRQFIFRLRAEQEIKEKVETLSRLRSISEAYQLANNREEIAYAFLSSVTAEQGLRFNRAFLFLYDEECDELAATLAVGPISAEEAGKTWFNLNQEGITFDDLLQDFKRIEKIKFTAIYQNFKETRLKCSGLSFMCQCIKRGEIRIVRQEEVHGDVDQEFYHSSFNHEFLIAPLNAKDKPVGVLIADNKITGGYISKDLLRYVEIICKSTQQAFERIRLYEQLQESVLSLKRSNQLLKEHQNRVQNLERLSAIGQMSAIVAHEIRNPLVTIGGFAKSLSDDLHDDDPNKKYVGIIFDEVQRLERVVKDLLDFAKPIKMDRKEVSLKDVVNQAVDMIQPAAEKAGIAVRSRITTNTMPVRIDPDLIRQLLLNLMSNAMEAMTDGGVLRIIASQRTDDIKITVSDTGTGIPEEFLDKLFEPFFTSKPSGTGLGLAIVKSIVSQHAGTIEVDSKLEEGTSFIITIPKNPEKTISSFARMQPTDTIGG
jgi:PAS domain S-box-containing protein